MLAPTVDVDCSNVCFKVVRNAQSVANFLTKWASHGIHMNPVCDGKVRPISKHATNECKANREKNRINAHHLHTEILALSRRLKTDGLTDTERICICREIATKQRSMKSKETQSRNVIQTNFEDKLVEELEATGAHSRNQAGGLANAVMIAEFQADAVMFGQDVAGKTLIVLTNDADIPLIAGDCCVAIKD